MNGSDQGDRSAAINGWYDLFSRGSRDWLRHSDKVREAVREHLPRIVADADAINHGNRTVRVPMKVLEHYQFRLRARDDAQGVGQGKAKPGDVLGGPAPASGGGEKGAGGTERGGIELMLEFKIDDIIDWLWEDLQLPNLQPRAGPTEQTEWTREGLDKRGARSRLDRRRSMKESIKRRARAPEPAGFTDEDLRFRQLARRRQPATRAVVFFVMDVSGSMSERDRKLAKMFFFWVAAGLRRQYRQLETVFVAHTTEAWEFNEPEFFQVTGSGGTVASTAFGKVHEIMEARFNPVSCNVYVFYASDGENAPDDSDNARRALTALASVASYSGYVEVMATGGRAGKTATWTLFDEMTAAGLPGGSHGIASQDDIWAAVRRFFSTEAQTVAAGGEAR